MANLTRLLAGLGLIAASGAVIATLPAEPVEARKSMRVALHLRKAG